MKMMRFRSRSVVALVLLLAASSAIASVDSQTLKLEEIREQQGKLQVELRAGKGAFKEMSEGDRSALLAKQDRLLFLLQGKQTSEDLNQDDRLEVFNILEQIKSAVAQAEDDRKVCNRIKLIGSNRPQIVCMTAKQAREQREKAQETFQGARSCNTAGCTGN
jgi:hypothetical protein